jgi:hypothetical protein
MLFESFRWKKEIKRHLLLFKKWSKRPETGRAMFYVERAVFLSAFILRKMMEKRKVTDAVRDRSVRCKGYRPFRPLSDRVSRFTGLVDPSHDYDMAKPEMVTISSFDLMSEIMHSYVLIPVADDSGQITAFLVNSYNKRDDRLLLIKTRDFEGIMSDAIQDDVREMTVYIHPTSGKVLAEVKGRKRLKK